MRASIDKEFLLNSRLLLFDELTRQIRALEDKIQQQAGQQEKAELLMT
jgi:hypothetical protein